MKDFISNHDLDKKDDCKAVQIFEGKLIWRWDEPKEAQDSLSQI